MLYNELAGTRRRLSIVVAQRESARADVALSPVTPPARPPHALLADCRRALDRVAELPALARQTAIQTVYLGDARLGAEMVVQADMVASVAEELGEVLRSQADRCGFRGEPHELRGEAAGHAGSLGAGLPSDLAALSSLGPNETDESLILVGETLSLAARLILVLTRSCTRRGRKRREMCAFRSRAAGWVARTTVRTVSVALSLSTDLVHPWRTAPLAVWAVTVLAVVLAVLVALVDRLAVSRPVRVLADLLGGVTSVALPHGVLALALIDVLTGNRPGRSRSRALERVGRGTPNYVGFTSHPARARRDHREHHRDR